MKTPTPAPTSAEAMIRHLASLQEVPAPLVKPTKPEDVEVTLPVTLLSMLETFEYVKAEQKRLNLIEKEAEAAIREALGTGTIGKINGIPVVSKEWRAPLRISQEKLKDQWPDAVADCSSYEAYDFLKVIRS